MRVKRFRLWYTTKKITCNEARVTRSITCDVLSIVLHIKKCARDQNTVVNNSYFCATSISMSVSINPLLTTVAFHITGACEKSVKLTPNLLFFCSIRHVPTAIVIVLIDVHHHAFQEGSSLQPLDKSWRQYVFKYVTFCSFTFLHLHSHLHPVASISDS